MGAGIREVNGLYTADGFGLNRLFWSNCKRYYITYRLGWDVLRTEWLLYRNGGRLLYTAPAGKIYHSTDPAPLPPKAEWKVHKLEGNSKKRKQVSSKAPTITYPCQKCNRKGLFKTG